MSDQETMHALALEYVTRLEEWEQMERAIREMNSSLDALGRDVTETRAKFKECVGSNRPEVVIRIGEGRRVLIVRWHEEGDHRTVDIREVI